MKINNLTVRFNDKVIFDNASFEAERGRLCIVKGKSGSGKTTLLKALVFRIPCHYEHDGVRLDVLSKEDQAAFLFDNVSIVEQEPLLDGDLTIGQNRDFIQKLYGVQDDATVAGLLSIDGLMKKYPMQLSQGERVRCALYLALLKRPDILLLDEPTASLDAKNKEAMIDILNQYAKEHVVVCSSHDGQLIHAADKVYEIKDGKLFSSQESFAQVDKQPLAITSHGYSGYMGLFARQFMHRWALNCLAKVILAAVVAFLFVSVSLNNVVMIQTKKAMNAMSSRELVIYQGGIGLDGYSYDGSEFPMSQAKVEKLSSVGNLVNVVPLITAHKMDVWLDEDPDVEQAMIYESYQRKDVLLDGDKVIEMDGGEERVHYDGPGEFDGTALLYKLCSYTEYDLQEYKGDMTVYHDEGIVVADWLYESLSGGQELSDPQLRFSLPVPLYNATGLSEVYADGEDDSPEPCNYQSPYPQWVTLPIRAVLGQGNLGMRKAGIYVPLDFWQEQIDRLMEERQVKESYELFSVCKGCDEETNVCEYERYIDQLPQEYIDSGFLEQDFSLGNTKDRHSILTKWRPLAYDAYVEDLSRIGETVNELKQLGLDVDNEYVDTQHMLTVQESLKRTLTVISSIALAIMLLGHVVVKWTQRSETERYMAWLRSLGYARKQRNNVMLSKRLWETGLLLALCIVGYEVTKFILLLTHTALIKPDPMMYVGIVAVCLFAELVVPMALKRRSDD